MPSPALMLSAVALFFALAGGAVAAGVVPLAKHALTADVALNAKKLGGKTPAQIHASLLGARGPQGALGPAGPQGPKGDTGATGGPGPQGPQGSQGPKGDTGAVGAGLKIVGTVAAPADLPATGTTGDGYLVAGDLYVWTGAAWTDAGPVRGPQGAQGAQGPQGAPGTAAVTVHTVSYSLDAAGGANDQQLVTATCGAGQKAVGGGFQSDGQVYNLDTFATAADDGWSIYLVNPDDTSGATGTVDAMCLG